MSGAGPRRGSARRNPARARIMALGVLTALAVGFYLMADGLLSWLRVVMHGR